MEKEDLTAMFLFAFGLPIAIIFIILIPFIGSATASFLDWWANAPPMIGLALFFIAWIIFVFAIFALFVSREPYRS